MVTWESSRSQYVRLNNKVWHYFYESRSSRWSHCTTFFITFYTADCRCAKMSFQPQKFPDDPVLQGLVRDNKDHTCRDEVHRSNTNTSQTKDLITDLKVFLMIWIELYVRVWQDSRLLSRLSWFQIGLFIACVLQSKWVWFIWVDQNSHCVQVQLIETTPRPFRGSGLSVVINKFWGNLVVGTWLDLHMTWLQCVLSSGPASCACFLTPTSELYD